MLDIGYFFIIFFALISGWVISCDWALIIDRMIHLFISLSIWNLIALNFNYYFFISVFCENFFGKIFRQCSIHAWQRRLFWFFLLSVDLLKVLIKRLNNFLNANSIAILQRDILFFVYWLIYDANIDIWKVSKYLQIFNFSIAALFSWYLIGSAHCCEVFILVF